MPRYDLSEVALCDFPKMQVALLHHLGPLNGSTIRSVAFIDWRRSHGLGLGTGAATYTVFHDDPEQVAPEAFRLDICVTTDRSIASNGAGVIPAGRCAVQRVKGASENLEQPALALCRDWLPASGERLRDFPLLCQRLTLFPHIPERRAEIDLFLPLL